MENFKITIMRKNNNYAKENYKHEFCSRMYENDKHKLSIINGRFIESQIHSSYILC